MNVGEQRRDEELILAYRAGEADAADALLSRYKPLVLKLSRARFIVGGDHDDLIQEGMIGLYKAMRDYDAEKAQSASFSTFAALCIDRQMLNAIEASQREKNRPLNTSLLLSDEEWDHVIRRMAESPETIVIDQEVNDEKLRKLWEMLSPMERKVLGLYVAGLEYREIAEALGKSPKSIDNALQRIRKKSAERTAGIKKENL